MLAVATIVQPIEHIHKIVWRLIEMMNGITLRHPKIGIWKSLGRSSVSWGIKRSYKTKDYKDTR